MIDILEMIDDLKEIKLMVEDQQPRYTIVDTIVDTLAATIASGSVQTTAISAFLLARGY